MADIDTTRPRNSILDKFLLNSLLKYTDDDFTPTGKLCYINENGEKLHRKLTKDFSTSDGIFNILLMNMNINMMTMSGPILYMKAIGPIEQTSIS